MMTLYGKYVWWTGDSWQIENSFGIPFALDSQDRPHVASDRVPTDSGIRTGFLNHLWWAENKWNFEIVDYDPYAYFGRSIAVDELNNIHISYFDKDNLKYARFNGWGWDVRKVDSRMEPGTFPMGFDTSIALDNQNRPHIAYSDGTEDWSILEVKCARWDGGSWEIETVSPLGDKGIEPLLALDSQNQPHIVYWEFHHDDLKHLWWTGSSWKIETIVHLAQVGIVGGHSMALDSSNNVHVSFSDGGKLAYARKEADTDGDTMPDTWETQYGLDPATDDAGQDPDGDGYTNLQEYQAGTDPNDATSHPAVAPAKRIQLAYIVAGAVVAAVLILVFVLHRRP